jgi:signal transduction histidine kinase
MSGSRKSLLAAVTLLVLISAVVLSGMTWATITQVRLAELKATAAHRSRVNTAVWRIEEHLSRLLASEAARPYTDYVGLHTDRPLAAWSADGHRLDADAVVLPSPVAFSGPPYEWIELYFYVDETGHWDSPQLLYDAAALPSVIGSLDWLRQVLPVGELGDRIARARERDRPLYVASGESHDQKVQVVRRLASGNKNTGSTLPSDYQQRRQRRIAAQLPLVPSAQCVEQEHIHLRDITAIEGSIYACSEPVEVGLSVDPMVTFWVEPMPGENPKLAFIRTGHEGDKVVYQGFIGDWSSLKPNLLALITDLFPGADLDPVPGDRPLDFEGSEFELTTIPARLTGADVADTGVAEARRSVLGVLIAPWVAAVMVLAIAGWGVWNLVSLTNRRLRFAYAVTHELRTPLTTFLLYSDMLSAGLVPEESKQEYLDTLNSESQRLSRLVKGVLEYARLENRRARLNPVDTNAPSILKIIAETLRKRCGENGVEAQTKNDVPDGFSVRTDVDLVNQIAGVLLDNAARHARGSANATVLLQLTGGNGHLNLEVIDSGPGVERADARTIFKPFRRGRGADVTAQRGIGLGLALARSWAGLLGGRLDLAARHDPEYGGAHFRLTIPTSLKQ